MKTRFIKCKCCNKKKKYYAKGSCYKCYIKNYYKRRYDTDPEFRERLIKQALGWKQENPKKYFYSNARYWLKKLSKKDKKRLIKEVG